MRDYLRQVRIYASEKWIEMYEQSRLKTKAGQAQMAKQGPRSESKNAAKRVERLNRQRIPRTDFQCAEITIRAAAEMATGGVER